MKRMSKNKNKNKGGNRPVASNASVTVAPASSSISAEDKELLELAKMLVEEGDKDLKDLIQKLAERANEEHKLELDVAKEEFLKNLDTEHADTLKEINRRVKGPRGRKELNRTRKN